MYILDEQRRPLLICASPSDRKGLLDWAKWIAAADERGELSLARERVGDKEVSTVFLGVNVNVSASKRPLVFETAILDRTGLCTVCGRTSSAEDAMAMHSNSLAVLRAATSQGNK
jgi:hypothetical protein